MDITWFFVIVFLVLLFALISVIAHLRFIRSASERTNELLAELLAAQRAGDHSGRSGGSAATDGPGR